jgi:aminocarboxymuconate-semialdehyde decarboxylase
MTEHAPEFFDVDAKTRVDGPGRAGRRGHIRRPPIYFYGLAPEHGIAGARLANDGIAQMVARYPDRLRGMGHLPMQDPDAAVAELERAVREHGFKAVELGTSIEGAPLADRSFARS